MNTTLSQVATSILYVPQNKQTASEVPSSMLGVTPFPKLQADEFTANKHRNGINPAASNLGSEVMLQLGVYLNYLEASPKTKALQAKTAKRVSTLMKDSDTASLQSLLEATNRLISKTRAKVQ